MARDVIQQIQKLFNLANSKDNNETEAAEALAMAQKLCAKHNLDVAAIKDSPMATGNTVVDEKREKTNVNRSAMYSWQRRLWAAMAEANFCWHWITEVPQKYNKRSEWSGELRERTRYVKRHILLGKESNVLVVRLMGEYICDTIERMCGEQWPNTERLSRQAISWRTGVADRLIDRIQEQAQKMREQSTTDANQNTTALALVDIDSREYEANYDAAYGKGAYQKAKAREKAQDEAYQQRVAEEQRQRIEMLQNETPEEKRKREDREEKLRIKADQQWQRNSERYRRQRQKESANIDWHAYNRGQAAGDRISLNPQIKEGGQVMQLSGRTVRVSDAGEL